MQGGFVHRWLAWVARIEQAIAQRQRAKKVQTGELQSCINYPVFSQDTCQQREIYSTLFNDVSRGVGFPSLWLYYEQFAWMFNMTHLKFELCCLVGVTHQTRPGVMFSVPWLDEMLNSWIAAAHANVRHGFHEHSHIWSDSTVVYVWVGGSISLDRVGSWNFEICFDTFFPLSSRNCLKMEIHSEF